MQSIRSAETSGAAITVKTVIQVRKKHIAVRYDRISTTLDSHYIKRIDTKNGIRKVERVTITLYHSGAESQEFTRLCQFLAIIL